jgi:hypothetical protein
MFQNNAELSAQMLLLLLCAIALPLATATQFYFDEHLHKSRLTSSLEEEACRDICPACYESLRLHLKKKKVELANFHARHPDAIIEHIKQFLPSGYEYDPRYPEIKHTTALSEDEIHLTSNPDENQALHFLFHRAVELSPKELFARANKELKFMRQVAKASFEFQTSFFPTPLS